VLFIFWMYMNKSIKYLRKFETEYIHRHWKNGYFYEQFELNYIKDMLGSNRRIVDVGANIGNHAIYFDKIMNSEVIYVIEPNEQLYCILLQNVALNYCHKVNVDYLGLALGYEENNCFIENEEMIECNNFGLSKINLNKTGNVSVMRGDSLFCDIPIDLLKIDVEGMELQVLQGFEKTINRYKPVLYLEIQNDNNEVIMNYINKICYKVVKKFNTTQNEGYTNYILISK